MKRWTRILPFFVVAWIARRKLGRQPIADKVCVRPYDDTFFVISALDDAKASFESLCRLYGDRPEFPGMVEEAFRGVSRQLHEIEG